MAGGQPREANTAAALLATSVMLLPGAAGCSRPTKSMRGRMAEYRDALEAYHRDHGEYPPARTAEELMRSLGEPIHASGGRLLGPYIVVRSPVKEAVDRWGTPLLYERSPDGQSFRLASAGQDQEFGTDNDILVESPRRDASGAGNEH